MDNNHQGSLIASSESFMQGGNNFDLTVICGLKEFKTHRRVLCTRSEFFAAAFNGDFAEAETGKIHLKEDDPLAVERMISYLYALDYDDLHSYYPDTLSVSGISQNSEPDGKAAIESTLSETEVKHSKLINNIAVFAIADKYNILPLKVLARSRFSAALTWPLHNLFLVTRTVFDLIPDREVDFRKLVLKIWFENSDEIILAEEFLTMTDCPLLESPILEMCLEKKRIRRHMKLISEATEDLCSLMKAINEEDTSSHLADDWQERENKFYRLERISQSLGELSLGMKKISQRGKDLDSFWISWGKN